MHSRRGFTAGSLLVLLSLALPAPAQGQTTTAASWQTSPASLLKNTLRAVGAAQARFRLSNRTYAPSAEVLELRPESGVRVEILAASATGWQAKATYQGQPGRSCVMFAGSVDGAEAPRTDEDHEMAGEEGVPLCDWMR
ncbi:MAG TPA: hypothetical protein VHR41_08555 [Gemmatimonadales bacterium]|nr:hypothetical protein [Gemmatimonadales bacterium]